jgi:hypothetical protein
MSNDLNKKLKVFKTITVMLANLSHTSALAPTDNLQILQWSLLQCQVLKVSDALAQLLVSQHEVVAVSTNISGPGLTMVACADQTKTQTEAESFQTFLDVTILPLGDMASRTQVIFYFYFLHVSTNVSPFVSLSVSYVVSPPF